jgi:putative nucleotidyltransferase with HDIG domain
MDRETARSNHPAHARLLVTSYGVLGIAAGAVASAFGATPDLRALLVVAALVAVGQVYALEIDHGTISAGAVAALAGVAMFGIRAALLLAAIAVVMDVATRRWKPGYAIVALGARTLGLLAAAGVFALGFGGTAGQLVTVALGALAGAVSFVVASAILDLALVLEGGEPGVRSWREHFSWLTPHYAVYGFVAAVAAVAYSHAGLYALVAFAVTLLAIHKTQEAIVIQARKNAQNLRHAAAMIQTQNVSLQRVNRLLKERSSSAMQSLSTIVDRRDAYTAGHSRRVCDLVLAMGRELGLSAADLEVLEYAALFHDIGKLTVPDAILLKPGPLTEEEWVVIRRHSEEGARIIERLGFLDESVPAIRYHHERIDGEGYPRGLQGEEIPLGARIVHAADAYDSMRTNRVYQAACSDAEALAELRKFAGTQFCAISVAALEVAVGNGTFGAKRVSGRGTQTAS